MAGLAIIGITVLGTLIGTSAFLFRRRANARLEDEKKEVVTLTLRGLQDIDSIKEIVSRGNMVILGIKELARLDTIRLKRSILQLRSYVNTTGGAMMALGKEFVVVVPPNMKLSAIRRTLESADSDSDIHPPDIPTEVGTL